MIIKCKPVVVFDIEIFDNVFSVIAKNTETKEVFTFEVSERKNQIREIIGLFEQPNVLFCGYNNHHYDDLILNYILINKSSLPNDYKIICSTLFSISNTIIEEQDFETYKTYKYAHCYDSMDLLTMLFSSKLRVD